ncbi:unnamed protein product [Cyclocybe aegerita]|uniref:Uncharacterized protein n=1 Tax=Cyclocybe aegerita TaxID=1973307 RepID=A0A8S0XLE1_CYCAE|nr:unnamed protein product [Cyclocybe aegerita]
MPKSSYTAMGDPKMSYPHNGMSFINLRPAAALNIGVTASVFTAAKSNFIPDELDATIASVIAATYVAGSAAYLARDFYSSTPVQEIFSRRYGLGEIIDADILLPHPEVLIHDAKVYGAACMRPQLAACENERAINNTLNVCASTDGPETDLAIVVQGGGVCSPGDAPLVVDSKVFGPACMKPSQLALFEYERAIDNMLTSCPSGDAPGKNIAVMIQGEGFCLPEEAPFVVGCKIYGPVCMRPSQLAAFTDEKIVCASGDGSRRSFRFAGSEVAAGSGLPYSSTQGGSGPGEESGNGSAGNSASSGDPRQPTRTVANGSKLPNKKGSTSKLVGNNDSPPPPPPPPPTPAVEEPEPSTNSNNTHLIFAIIIGVILVTICGAALKSSSVKRFYPSIRAQATKRSWRQKPTVVVSRATALLILAFMAFFYVDCYVNPCGRSLKPGEAISQPTSFVVAFQRRVVAPQPRLVVPQPQMVVVPQPLVTEPPMRLAFDKSYYTMDYRLMASPTARATSVPLSSSASLLDDDLMVWGFLVLALLLVPYIIYEFVKFIRRIWINSRSDKWLFARRVEPAKSESMPISSPEPVLVYTSQIAIPNAGKSEDPLSGVSDDETPFVDIQTEFSSGQDSTSVPDFEVTRPVIDKGKGKAVEDEDDETIETEVDETYDTPLSEFEEAFEEMEEAAQMLAIEPPDASFSNDALDKVESANDPLEVLEKTEEVTQMHAVEAVASSSSLTLDSASFVPAPPPVASSSSATSPPTSMSPSGLVPTTTATELLESSEEAPGEVPGRRRRKRRHKRDPETHNTRRRRGRRHPHNWKKNQNGEDDDEGAENEAD